MASLIYNGSTSQTTTYAATDIYTLAVAPGTITNISQQGANVVIQTGATSLTIAGVTLAQLVSGNFAIQGGGSFVAGDNTASTIADQFGNNIDLSASAGNDIVLGLGGNDTINAGAGNNLVFGGSAQTDTADGADSITTGAGNDTIYGNAGNDTISSGGGADVVFGGIGNDSITTGALTGNASVYGGGGFTDTVDGADTIIVAGSTGSLFLTGNAGNDTINVGGTTAITGSSSVYGGIGADSITVNATSGNHLIAGGSGGAATDQDTIIFTGNGGASNVTIYGGVGITDTVDGADSISATGLGAGSTAFIYGNAGNDTITVETAGAASIYGGVGTDSITLNAGAATARVQIFAGSADGTGADTVNAAAFLGNTTIYGGNGINDSADGADLLIGGLGDDVIYGNGGNDTIISGQGNNTLFGGVGNDLFVANDAARAAGTAATTTTVADYVAGSDTVLVNSFLIGAGSTVSANASGLQVTNGTAADTLQIQGTLAATGSTLFTGRIDNGAAGGAVAGNNAVDASDGLFVVNTSATGASITGGANNDYLAGNTGNDTIIGGAGDNTIIGGAGVDRIDVTAGGNDTIIVRTGDASTVGFGTTNGTTLAPTAGATFTGTEVIFGLTSGDTIVTGNASLVADQAAGAAGSGTLGENEFLIVSGTYNALTGVFTQGAAGAAAPDSILLYDGSSAAGVQQEAIVLVGVTNTEAANVVLTGAGSGTLGTFGA